GRSEPQLGSATVRVALYTELSVLNLDDRTAQLRVTEGSVSVRVWRLDPDDVVEVDTPNGAVWMTQPGLYRVDVNQTGDATTVTVRRGQAEITTPDGETVLAREQQSLVFAGLQGTRPEYRRAMGIDAFED